ncbi:MAG: glutathione S-transferase family protein [Aestuariivirga sp.]
MYVLYGTEGSGSAAVEALFDELDIPFHLEFVARDEHGAFPASFSAISPLLQVPVLQLPDGAHITESAAMMIYLADLKPEARIAPGAADPQRPHYLRVLLFLAASTYQASLRIFFSDRYSTDQAAAPGIKAAGERDMWRDLSILSSLLGDKEWFTGAFSAVDIYAAMLSSWCGDLPALVQREPRLSSHYNRVKARPKAGAAFARNML